MSISIHKVYFDDVLRSDEWPLFKNLDIDYSIKLPVLSIEIFDDMISRQSLELKKTFLKSSAKNLADKIVEIVSNTYGYDCVFLIVIFSNSVRDGHVISRRRAVQQLSQWGKTQSVQKYDVRVIELKNDIFSYVTLSVKVSDSHDILVKLVSDNNGLAIISLKTEKSQQNSVDNVISLVVEDVVNRLVHNKKSLRLDWVAITLLCKRLDMSCIRVGVEHHTLLTYGQIFNFLGHNYIANDHNI